MATLLEIVKAVKELSFDRFLVPTLHVKGYSEPLELTATGLNVGESFIPFDTSYSLGDLVDDLIAAGVVVATDGYFVADEPAYTLRPGQKILAATEGVFQRRNFFSDATVRGLIADYYIRVMHIRLLPATELMPDPLATSLEFMDVRRVPHLCLWCAYFLLEKRRRYEMAQEMLGTSNWSDGTGTFNNGAGGNGNTTVQVGSVFTLTEDNSTGFIDAEFDRIGSRNTLGDGYGFWFRIQMDIRARLERDFGDFSLRPDEVMMGRIELEKPLNYFAYYDSYPYTLSPLLRGILS